MVIVSPVQRWRNFKHYLRLKYAPKVVDWLVGRATARAQAKLDPNAALRILVDNTVLYHAVTHETGWVSTGTKEWGANTINTGYSARIPVHAADTDTREYLNVSYLPGIAHLCRLGLVELCTSAELQAERFSQPPGRYRGYGYSDHSLFNALSLKRLDGHVFPTMGPRYLRVPTKVQQRRRIEQHRDDEEFDALARTLGASNSQDAWHIYTAQKHGCFCFLTMDFKLIRTVKAQANSSAILALTTKVLTPEALGRELGLIRIPPRLFSYHDASYPVRSDLSMPGSKRRPRSGYK